ncbi:Heterogeneous nuclear ribonucleoprotein L [Apis cerana cerana]|uniref:Heterogeneous nuclear ribonucleoprotein L n=1 Tax=Apis cerana cerana TaxID=94128 RepID=A0A2A3EDZ3_APICC|nr:Heterogeneous nuclear ribonucleoprotein L [Apis cerana cerana]
MGVVMLECLSVCRCSLLVVHLTVMMDSRGTESGPGENVGLRQVYGSYTLSPYYCLRRVRVIVIGLCENADIKSSVLSRVRSRTDRGDRENTERGVDHDQLYTLGFGEEAVRLCLEATDDNNEGKQATALACLCTRLYGSSAHKNDATGNGRPAPLLAEPRYGAAPQPYGSTPQVTFPPGAGHDRYEENFNGPATYAEPYVERYGIKSDFSGREPLHPTPPRPGYVPTLGQTPPSSTQGSVMMVYGLQPDKVNTDKLFNLFCLYGNVTKVKFLKTKEGCAMIQMGDSIAVERCLQNLNNVTIGTDGRLQLGFSKQAFLSDVTNPYILPDKTASFKDFTGSKNNRFLNPAMANKNRIQPPSKIVHFFNTPPDLTEETVHRVFVERGIEAPTTVKLFPLKSERSSSGLIEFSSVGIAVAAIMECNHTALENSSDIKRLDSAIRNVTKKVFIFEAIFVTIQLEDKLYVVLRGSVRKCEDPC